MIILTTKEGKQIKMDATNFDLYTLCENCNIIPCIQDGTEKITQLIKETGIDVAKIGHYKGMRGEIFTYVEYYDCDDEIIEEEYCWKPPSNIKEFLFLW